MNHQYRKKLEPLTDNPENRPLISVMIPTHNCNKYLKHTLISVLQQDLGKELMQICVVDDYSTENPLEVIRELNTTRIEYYRQNWNVGHVKNFETCLEKSKGIYVHLLHGDDKVVNGFYNVVLNLIQTNEDYGAVFCRNYLIDENENNLGCSRLIQNSEGEVANFLSMNLERQNIQTPSIIVRRAVYEHLGMFDRRLSWSEDWEMWTRIAANYKIGYSPQIMCYYRIHSGSNTGKYFKTGENLKDLIRLKDLLMEWVPKREQKSYNLFMNDKVCKSAFNKARDFYSIHKDKNSSFNQINAAIFLKTSLKLKFRLLKLYVLILISK